METGKFQAMAGNLLVISEGAVLPCLEIRDIQPLGGGLWVDRRRWQSIDEAGSPP